MERFEEGDAVRVDIPDRSDPDYRRLHGERGVVVDVIEDDAGLETGDERDSQLFIVELENGATESLRWRDLRPATLSEE